MGERGEIEGRDGREEREERERADGQAGTQSPETLSPRERVKGGRGTGNTFCSIHYSRI